jgi:hypothetical protein
MSTASKETQIEIQPYRHGEYSNQNKTPLTTDQQED